MTGGAEWTGRVGASWAQEWQRTDRSFGELTDRLVDVASARGFVRALDIGCGAGELVVRLAERHPAARVLGIDISPDLLAAARGRCQDLPNARIEESDASIWCAPSGEAPDLLVSRHGVMFFDEPVAAFAHLRRQARPGVRLVFSCFRERDENIWVEKLASVLPPADGPPPAPDAPGPFAFGRREKTTRILSEAGWCDIAFEAVDYSMIAGAGEDPVDDALSYFLRIGPAARSIAALPDTERYAAIGRLREMLSRHLGDGCVSLPAAGWLVTANAPD